MAKANLALGEPERKNMECADRACSLHGFSLRTVFSHARSPSPQPHPNPLPKERESHLPARRKIETLRMVPNRTTILPLLGERVGVRGNGLNKAVGYSSRVCTFAFPIPKGLRPPAQGCEERATLGSAAAKSVSTSNEVASLGVIAATCIVWFRYKLAQLLRS